jgi:hypothetical protein
MVGRRDSMELTTFKSAMDTAVDQYIRSMVKVFLRFIKDDQRITLPSTRQLVTSTTRGMSINTAESPAPCHLPSIEASRVPKMSSLLLLLGKEVLATTPSKRR